LIVAGRQQSQTLASCLHSHLTDYETEVYNSNFCAITYTDRRGMSDVTRIGYGRTTNKPTSKSMWPSVEAETVDGDMYEY